MTADLGLNLSIPTILSSKKWWDTTDLIHMRTDHAIHMSQKIPGARFIKALGVQAGVFSKASLDDSTGTSDPP